MENKNTPKKRTVAPSNWETDVILTKRMRKQEGKSLSANVTPSTVKTVAEGSNKFAGGALERKLSAQSPPTSLPICNIKSTTTSNTVQGKGKASKSLKIKPENSQLKTNHSDVLGFEEEFDCILQIASFTV